MIIMMEICMMTPIDNVINNTLRREVTPLMCLMIKAWQQMVMLV